MKAHLSLIGFGEAGATFAASAQWQGNARAYDLDPGRRPAMERCAVTACASVETALADADIILSLVTAGQALAAAEAAASCVPAGALYCDLNSIAPQTKQQAANAIEQAGARYLDVAVLAPVNPAGMAVPLLVSGPGAEEGAELLGTLGFSNIRVVGEEVGKASAIKMIRSVMVKGLEALSDEMMAAAQEAGVADAVLASLDASWRDESWSQRVAYNLERMETHGLRRAEEMEQVARTLQGLGLDPLMTQATIVRQRSAAGRTRKEGTTE